MGCCVTRAKEDDFTAMEDEKDILRCTALDQQISDRTYYGTCSHHNQPTSSSNTSQFWNWLQENNRLAPDQYQHQSCISHLVLAVYNAELTAAAIAGLPVQPYLNVRVAERIVRKAKHEGSTVTIRDGHLYIDYKYIGRVPAEVVAVS